MDKVSSEMGQWTKALYANCDDLSLTPGIHKVEGEHWSLEVVL